MAETVTSNIYGVNRVSLFFTHGIATLGAGINVLTDTTDCSTLFSGLRPHLMTLHSHFDCPLLCDG
jgi:hypothetical protein